VVRLPARTKKNQKKSGSLACIKALWLKKKTKKKVVRLPAKRLH
jgi:hypothetical protein